MIVMPGYARPGCGCVCSMRIACFEEAEEIDFPRAVLRKFRKSISKMCPGCLQHSSRARKTYIALWFYTVLRGIANGMQVRSVPAVRGLPELGDLDRSFGSVVLLLRK